MSAMNAQELGNRPPDTCRQRLRAEGRPYPRSGCVACGKWSPRASECDAILAREAKEAGDGK